MFNVTNRSLNAIRENKILAKISGFTVMITHVPSNAIPYKYSLLYPFMIIHDSCHLLSHLLIYLEVSTGKGPYPQTTSLEIRSRISKLRV